MYECKRVFQPIETTWADSAAFILKIYNRSAVQNAQVFTPVLLIRENGKIIIQKTLSVIDLAAGADTRLNIAAYLPKLKTDAEYHADIQFLLPAATAWAPKGFVMASDQLTIKGVTKSATTFKVGTRQKFTETADAIEVQGKDFTIKVKRTGTGGLYSYSYKGKEQLAQPFIPHFTRPLTDNDKRGWKPNRTLKQWYEADIKVSNVTQTVNSKGEPVIVTDYRLINDSARVQVVYTVADNGAVKVNYELTVKPGLPNIPKVGMQGGIHNAYQTIEWLGKGPLENYIDRAHGFDVGIYKMDIYDFMEPYAVPQENGNRTDVRWMYLGDPKTNDGLLVVADSLLSMSAWPYTQENIQGAKHTNKLQAAGYITLNIDLKQMGVGGNDSWSPVAAPLEQYQLPATNYQYAFYLLPFNSKKSNPATGVKFVQ